MAHVRFTSHLKRFFPTLTQDLSVSAATIAEVVSSLESSYPGIQSYLVDERGRLRKHVNIFIDGDMIRDKETLGDAVNESTQVFILQALSGG
jgi:molybdopterin converting factor small subunit